ncbi:MAG: NUDIX domain-containing protein [Patescibacteria group bacterium]
MKQNTISNSSKLKYRNGVIGLILNKDKRILIVQSVDYGKNEWRFPGGGIEAGELSKNALLRELLEELGTNKFEIIKKSDVVIKYDWPLEVIKKRLIDKGKTYKGQIQIQYLVNFVGNLDEIKITKKELRKIKWVSFRDLKLYFKFPGQLENARKTIEGFGL